jgi:DnaJ-class molecular chaperone
MNIDQHLATLGLDRGADRQQVREAYRKLVMRFHPDRNPGGVERFRSIRVAYEALMAAAVAEAVVIPQSTQSTQSTHSTHSTHLSAASASHSGGVPSFVPPESADVSANPPSERERRTARRGTPGHRRFEFIMEDQYKGVNVRVVV